VTLTQLFELKRQFLLAFFLFLRRMMNEMNIKTCCLLVHMINYRLGERNIPVKVKFGT